MLRRVSKEWNQTLDKDDAFVWENIIELTHGRDAANRLRRSLSPRRGYELARHIHLRKKNHDTDEPTVRLRTTDDLTCLIEFGRRDTKSGWKIHVASIYATWDELSSGIERSSSSRTLPTIAMPNLGFPEYDYLEGEEKEGICNTGRVTIFRRDSQQRVGMELELEYVEETDEFKGQSWFGGYGRGGWDHFLFTVTFDLGDWGKRAKVDTMLKVKLLTCKIMLQYAHDSDDSDNSCDETDFIRIRDISNGNELLGVLYRLSWT